MAGAPGARRRAIEELLRASEQIEDRLSGWQSSAPPPTRDEIRAARDEYLAWFHRAQPFVAEGDRTKFIDRYEGGSFIARIRAFLNDPLAANALTSAAGPPSSLLSRWQHPFEERFRSNAEAQRDLLRAALHGRARVDDVLDELSDVFRRLPAYLRVLEGAGSPAVPAPTIHAEADLQVVVEAMLRLLYDDVRAEDPVPQRAGASSRVDFYLREAEVVIETKMTRRGLADRRIGEELAVDFERYQSHPACRGVLALVYDPDRRVKNPRGLEHDLTRPGTEPTTKVIVVQQ